MSTLPQVAKQAKGKGIRIDAGVLLEMNEEQVRLYRATGRKTPVIDLITEAWALYKANRDKKAKGEKS